MYKINCVSVSKFLICFLLFYMDFVQYKVFTSSNFLLVLGVLVIASTLLVVYKTNNGYIRLPIYIWSFIGLMLYMLLIPTLFSSNISNTIAQWLNCMEYTLIMVCIVYICMICKDVEWLIKTVVYIMLIVCASFFISPAVYHDKINTIQYTLVSSLNPNTFGLMLLFGIWCSLYLISKKKLQIISCVTVCACVVAILMSASRKSLICAIFCIGVWVVWIYLGKQFSKSYKQKQNKLLLVFILIIVCGYIILPYFLESQMFTRLLSFVSGNDGSILSRLAMYVEGFALVLDNPVFGTGMAGYANVHGGYSHSTIVEIAVSGGLIGFLWYFYILIKATVASWNSVKRLGDRNEVKDKVITVKQITILWLVILFLCIGVIHLYAFNSYVMMATAFALYEINKTC